MDPIIIRGIERILAVVIGGMTIYLGYRLFLKLPDRTDSHGKLILPGGISVFMSRVGPGAFFVLFGSAVIALAIYMVLTTDEGSAVRYFGPSAKPEERAYLPYRGNVDVTLKQSRADLRGDIFLLNQLCPASQAGACSEDLRQALVRIKLALMWSLWGPDWGDYWSFRKWIENGAQKPVPSGLEKPAEFFHHGTG